MKIIDEGESHAIFQCTGHDLLASLPPESVDAVLFQADGQDDSAALIERVLRPGGLVFAIGRDWSRHLSNNGIVTFSDQGVCLAGKPNAERFLFHALTCAEDSCDSCSIQYLSGLSPYEIADELVPFVATRGIVAVPWNYALMESVVRRQRTAVAAREL